MGSTKRQERIIFLHFLSQLGFRTIFFLSALAFPLKHRITYMLRAEIRFPGEIVAHSPPCARLIGTTLFEGGEGPKMEWKKRWFNIDWRRVG